MKMTENNKNKKILKGLIKEYKSMTKKYEKERFAHPGLKNDINQLGNDILELNSKIKHNSIIVNIEKRKTIKECDKKIDNMVLDYKAMNKSLDKYEKEGSEFSKKKADKLKIKIKKIEKDILRINEEKELAAK